MPSRVLRHLIVVFSLVALVAAGLLPAMAVAKMATPAMVTSTASEAPMPCCPEKAPSCMTDVGCVFLVGLPVSRTVSAALSASLLTYRISHDRAEGLSIRPALGPPILPA